MHNTAKYWGYTSLWNLLDYPAVSFPVDKVDKAKDGINEAFNPLTELDEENFKLCKSQCKTLDVATDYSPDDPELFDKMPISLQLVGRRFEDEKVLAILEYVTEYTSLPFCHFP